MRVLIIVPAAHLSEARSLTQSLFGQTSAQAALTFVPAGSPTGATPATYHWLSMELTVQNAATLQAQAPHVPWAIVKTYDLIAQSGTPAQQLAALGIKPITPTHP